MLSLCGETQGLETISEQTSLDSGIQRGVCSKGWHLVDLDQVWFQSTIDHDIESKNLKAQLVAIAIRMATPDQMCHVRRRQAKTLNYYVVYCFLKFV